jgi:anti-sigma factor RsiW
MPKCDDLIAFADGAMEEREAEDYRSHLRSCERCQHELIAALMLSARLSELRPVRPVAGGAQR